MKRLLFTGLVLSIVLAGMQAQFDASFQQESAEKYAITLGFLQGGGSLIGVDLEYLVGEKIGIQAGGGFVGFGAGLNYHLQPDIRSSFITLGYWHQGIGDSFAQSVLGPSFVFRAKRFLQAQLGIGYRLNSGPSLPSQFADTDVMLLYAIGLYFPF